MKNLHLVYLITVSLLTSCSGVSPLPPFEYSENTRIIIEGIINDSEGNALSGQVIELKFKRYEYQSVYKTVSNSVGGFYISVPKSNYEYTLFFEDRKIISVQKQQGILTADIENPPLFFGTIGNLINNYYNFNVIKLK